MQSPCSRSSVKTLRRQAKNRADAGLRMLSAVYRQQVTRRGTSISRQWHTTSPSSASPLPTLAGTMDHPPRRTKYNSWLMISTRTCGTLFFPKTASCHWI